MLCNSYFCCRPFASTIIFLSTVSTRIWFESETAPPIKNVVRSQAQKIWSPYSPTIKLSVERNLVQRCEIARITQFIFLIFISVIVCGREICRHQNKTVCGTYFLFCHSCLRSWKRCRLKITAFRLSVVHYYPRSKILIVLPSLSTENFANGLQRLCLRSGGLSKPRLVPKPNVERS